MSTLSLDALGSTSSTPQWCLMPSFLTMSALTYTIPWLTTLIILTTLIRNLTLPSTSQMTKPMKLSQVTVPIMHRMLALKTKISKKSPISNKVNRPYNLK